MHKHFLIFKTRDEEGISLPEAMVASIIVLVVLVFTAFGLASSFTASISSDNANKAQALINQQLAVASQAPFNALGTNPIDNGLKYSEECFNMPLSSDALSVSPSTKAAFEGGRTVNYNGDTASQLASIALSNNSNSAYAGEPIVEYKPNTGGDARDTSTRVPYGYDTSTSTSTTEGLELCKTEQYSSIGTTFYALTVVTGVNTAPYNTPGFQSKRTTVTVFWIESRGSEGGVQAEDGTTVNQRVVRSLQGSSIRTPSSSDCIPGSDTTGSGNSFVHNTYISGSSCG